MIRARGTCCAPARERLFAERPKQANFGAISIEMDVAALLASAKADPAVDVGALLKASAKGGQSPTSDKSKSERDLVAAAKSGDSDALKRIIEQAGASVDLNCAPGFDGNTPLHWAVEKGHLECVRVLCEEGANVDCRERWQNWSPLMLAASKARTREAALLLSHGADLNAIAKGRTAMDIAAGHDEMLAILRTGRAPKSSRRSESTAMQADASKRHCYGLRTRRS